MICTHFFHLIQLFITILLLYYANSAPSVPIPTLNTGIVTPLIDTCDINTIYDYYGVTTNLNPAVTSSAISLIGFEGIVQSSIYIKASINNFNTTNLIISVECLQTTIFSKLRFSYIFIDKSTVTYLFIYSACFLCGSSQTALLYKNYTFSAETHSSTDNSLLQISSSISSFNMSSNAQNGYSVRLSTSMLPSNTSIIHLVQTFSQTLIVSICITTIIYDIQLTSTAYDIVYARKDVQLTVMDKTDKLVAPSSMFQNVNSMFFGIKAIQINMLADIQFLILFDFNDYVNFNPNFKTNNNLLAITLSAIYIRQKTCGLQSYMASTFTCGACPAGMSPDPIMKYCLVCDPTCQTCSGTQINQCQTCNGPTMFRELSSAAPSTCRCKYQTYLEPSSGTICLSCSSFVPNCLTCSSATNCLTCTVPLVFNAIRGRCDCANQSLYLVQGQCLTTPGCTTVGFSTNMPMYCAVCDTGLNFQSNRTNISDIRCQCKQYYAISVNQINCVDKCGDGVIITSDCDDANTASGDGCSSTCSIQNNYSCYYDQTISKSICAPMRNLTISYISTSRVLSSNTALITFLISPCQPLLQKMSLSSLLSFSFPSKIISIQYDPTTSFLQVLTSYEVSLEGTNHNVSLRMDQTVLVGNTLNVSFGVKGQASWVVYSRFQLVDAFVPYIVLAIVGLAWVVALVAAMLGFKNLSLQLFLPIQAIHFILISLNSKSASLISLQYLSLINGYNYLDGLSSKPVASLTDHNYIYSDFFKNVNYFIIVNLTCFIMLMLLQKITNYVQQTLQQTKIDYQMFQKQYKQTLESNKRMPMLNMEAVAKAQQKQNQQTQRFQIKKNQLQQLEVRQSRLRIVLEFAGYRFCRTILLLSIQLSIFYFMSLILLKLSSAPYSLILNLSLSLISLIISIHSLLTLASKPSQKLLSIPQKYSCSYQKILTFIFVIFIILLAFVNTFSIGLTIIIPFVWIVIGSGWVVSKNPHENYPEIWKKLFIWLQYGFMVLAIASLNVVSFISTYDSVIYQIVSFTVIGCIIFAILITIFRIVLQYKLRKSQEILANPQLAQDKQLNEQNQKGKGKGNRLLNQQASQQQNSQDSQRISHYKDLQVIKKQLRDQLRAKRNGIRQ